MDCPTLPSLWRSGTRGHMKSLGWVHTIRTDAFSEPVADAEVISDWPVLPMVSILVTP